MTPEERAEKYIKELRPFASLEEDDRIFEAYIKGWEEAMRWRDPIAEKGELFETVFVKAEKRWEGRSTETFYTTSSRVGSFIFECEGSKKMYDGSYSQVKVIGWRPIENHINK